MGCCYIIYKCLLCSVEAIENLLFITESDQSRDVIDTHFEKVAPMKAVNSLAGGKKQSVPMVTLDKHVGEMDAEELEESLLNPDTRVLKQITIEDKPAADILFDQLMGTMVVPRKKYIEEHSHEVEVEV